MHTCWEAFPKFITNIFTYDSIAQIVIGALCYLWLAEWYTTVLLPLRWFVVKKFALRSA